MSITYGNIAGRIAVVWARHELTQAECLEAVLAASSGAQEIPHATRVFLVQESKEFAKELAEALSCKKGFADVEEFERLPK